MLTTSDNVCHNVEQSSLQMIQLYTQWEKTQTLYIQVHFDLKTLTDWFKANQLSVNPSKTKSILFMRSGYVNDINDYLCIETEPIELVQVTKFLGLYIDEHLT